MKIQLTLYLTLFLIACNHLLAQTPTQLKNIQAIEDLLWHQADWTTCETELQTYLKEAAKDTTTLYYGELLLRQAQLQYEKGYYQSALIITKRLLHLSDQQNFTPLLTTTKAFYAFILTEYGRLEEAQEYMDQAMEWHLIQKDTHSIRYAKTLFYTAKLKREQRLYPYSDSLFASAIKKSAEDTILQILIWNEWAFSALEQRALETGFKYLEQASVLSSKTLHTTHPYHAYTDYHRALYYYYLKDYEQAAALNKKVVAYRTRYSGIHHPLTALALRLSAKLYSEQAMYSKAEEDLLKCKMIQFNTFGANYKYAYVLKDLGVCYAQLGRYDLSNELLFEAKDIFKKGNNLNEYADVLLEIAAYYRDKEEMEKAAALYLEGQSVLGEDKDNIYYVSLIMNFATFYEKQKLYNKALPLYLEAKEKVVKLYGTEHIFYADVISNLADLYFEIGKYEAAYNMDLEILKLDKNAFGTRHPYYLMSLYKLAADSRMIEQAELALKYYQEANAGQLRFIKNAIYSSFTEKTRLSYLEDINIDFEAFFSFVLDQADLNNIIIKEAQNLQLAIKSLALDFSTDNQLSTISFQDSSLSNLNERYQAMKKKLGTAYLLSEEERTQANIDISDLEYDVGLLEGALSKKSSEFSNLIVASEEMSWQNLQSQLQTNEIAIDFLKFQYRTPQRKTDSIYYCALVTKKNAASPTLLYLAEEKQLARILKADVLQNGNNYIEDPSIGYDLYQLIWQPLQPYLEDIETIKISPTGLLHRVAFAALPTDLEGKNTLTQQFRFDYYGNMRDFIRSKKTTASEKSITLMGGAYFNLDSMQLMEISQQLQAEKAPELVLEDDLLAFATLSGGTRSVQTDSTRSAVEFNYLSGTATEVESIQNLFAKKDWTVNTYLGEAALEDRIKQLEGEQAPSILHLATHGYFFNALEEASEDADENLRTRILSAENPLLRSGLVLSGANYRWKGGARIPNLDDGILTAFEISNLNLFNTDLVVLSACETGLGDIYDTEGVFGLQRAFKAAGVDQLLISLWKVPDQQTLELMQYFYKFYLKSGNTAEALHKAQLKMSKKYRAYYWGAFVLMD